MLYANMLTSPSVKFYYFYTKLSNVVMNQRLCYLIESTRKKMSTTKKSSTSINRFIYKT